MTRAMTPAEAALQSAQTRQPPLYPKNTHGRDRVQALAGLLEWPDALQQRRDDGRIALGEIGDWQPDARTYGVDEQNYVIEVTSGYMDFLYALGRAMAGASVVYGRDGSVKNAQGLSASNVADLAAQTLNEWQKHFQPRLLDLFWKEKRIQHARFDYQRQPATSRKRSLPVPSCSRSPMKSGMLPWDWASAHPLTQTARSQPIWPVWLSTCPRRPSSSASALPSPVPLWPCG